MTHHRASVSLSRWRIEDRAQPLGSLVVAMGIERVAPMLVGVVLVGALSRGFPVMRGLVIVPRDLVHHRLP
jgi:hypothetical protein